MRTTSPWPAVPHHVLGELGAVEGDQPPAAGRVGHQLGVRDVGGVRRVEAPDAAAVQVEDRVGRASLSLASSQVWSAHRGEDRALALVQVRRRPPTGASPSVQSAAVVLASAGWKSNGSWDGLSTKPTYQVPSIRVNAGSQLPALGGQRRRLGVQHVHPAQQVVGGRGVADVDRAAARSLPRSSSATSQRSPSRTSWPAWSPSTRPSRRREQLRLQPHLGRRARGPGTRRVQCACWKKPRPAQVQVRWSRPSRTYGVPSACCTRCGSRSPVMPKSPGAAPRRRSPAPGVGVVAEHVLAAQVHQGGDLGRARSGPAASRRRCRPARSPGSRRARTPGRTRPVSGDRPAPQHRVRPSRRTSQATAARSRPTSGPARGRRPAATSPAPTRVAGRRRHAELDGGERCGGRRRGAARRACVPSVDREARRDQLERAEAVGVLKRQVEDGGLLGAVVGGRPCRPGERRRLVRVAGAARQTSGADGAEQHARRAGRGAAARRHPFRPERETPSMTNRWAKT